MCCAAGSDRAVEYSEPRAEPTPGRRQCKRQRRFVLRRNNTSTPLDKCLSHRQTGNEREGWQDTGTPRRCDDAGGGAGDEDDQRSLRNIDDVSKCRLRRLRNTTISPKAMSVRHKQSCNDQKMQKLLPGLPVCRSACRCSCRLDGPDDSNTADAMKPHLYILRWSHASPLATRRTSMVGTIRSTDELTVSSLRK